MEYETKKKKISFDINRNQSDIEKWIATFFFFFFKLYFSSLRRKEKFWIEVMNSSLDCSIIQLMKRSESSVHIGKWFKILAGLRQNTDIDEDNVKLYNILQTC